MNLKEIKEMIEVMKDNDISEFKLERNGFKVLLKRGAEIVTTMAMPQGKMTSMPGTQAAPHATPQTEEKKTPEHIKEIRSPMVGTFYRAPSPESPPYVQKGQTVGLDDVLCIIEAMKVMNEIKSEIRGKIVDILVENGQAVEFDQPMFRIDIS